MIPQSADLAAAIDAALASEHNYGLLTGLALSGLTVLGIIIVMRYQGAKAQAHDSAQERAQAAAMRKKQVEKLLLV